ncbi:OB-fold protein [Flavobacterium hercynium]|uniref:tRNA_anti-like n=1 Tax=Flavobacterium hercynium TaxID=387094 RepID=A0A226GVQ2_9FLAO|nr:hypothetical protein [Flavobacterium hercynium]OXA85995.1 hypothetical protein B0A66_18495 [Flavobacterium hercynium]SMP37276.1 tRNA_anti-like [Flavobacterium hercynium]
MKRKKIVYLTAALLILISAGIYIYYGFLFKEARNIETEMPDASITAAALIKAYTSDPVKADSLYLNKTIEVQGVVTKETDSVMILDNKVFCLFTKKNNAKLLSTETVIKGKCIGYDELFEEIKLDQCTITPLTNNQNN